MESVSSSSLRRRRRQLVKALPPIEQIVRGSLMETYKRCGRAGCHCVDGPGHGPKRYLSTIARTGERPRLGHVPNAEGSDHAECEECPSSYCTAILHLHAPIDDGTSSSQSGEHRASVQSSEPSEVARLDSGADPDSRRGSRTIRPT